MLTAKKNVGFCVLWAHRISLGGKLIGWILRRGEAKARGVASRTEKDGKWVPAVVIVIQLRLPDTCKHCCKCSRVLIPVLLTASLRGKNYLHFGGEEMEVQGKFCPRTLS